MGYRSIRLGRLWGVLPDLETKQEEKKAQDATEIGISDAEQFLEKCIPNTVWDVLKIIFVFLKLKFN